MERNIEQELQEVRREVNSLRDQAISAKAMMSNAETQISETISTIAQLISEDKRDEFNQIAETFKTDLTSEDAKEKMFSWISEYLNLLTQSNTEMIDNIKTDIARWKEIVG